MLKKRRIIVMETTNILALVNLVGSISSIVALYLALQDRVSLNNE